MTIDVSGFSENPETILYYLHDKDHFNILITMSTHNVYTGRIMYLGFECFT